MNTGVLLVHIPKCAGVSLSYALYGSVGGPGHQPVMRYLEASSPNTFITTYKFAVVRNPWDRIVSAYNFLKSGGLNDKDHAFSENHLKKYECFDDFVRGWLTPKTMTLTPHFTPQTSYLSLNAEQKTPLDDILFFENLNRDLTNAPHDLLRTLELSKKNQSPGDKIYHLDYYSPASLEIVEELYKEDIKLLGYTKDNSSLSIQIAARDRIFRSDSERF